MDELLKKLLEIPLTEYPSEDLLDPILDEYSLETDQIGNRYIVIGDNPNTMFTAHIDTVGSWRRKWKTSTIDKIKTTFKKIVDKNKKRGLMVTGSYVTAMKPEPLGADDRAGVYVMLKMIEAEIPGLYLFPVGEECGGIGSTDFLTNSPEMIKDIKKCISFDRYGFTSVITHQGLRTASDEFAYDLCRAFEEQGMFFKPDDGGVFTDSQVFSYDIPECTNLSVGYLGQHSDKEKLNFVFLKRLVKACININWEDLKYYRKPEPKATEYVGNYSIEDVYSSSKTRWGDDTCDDCYLYYGKCIDEYCLARTKEKALLDQTEEDNRLMCEDCSNISYCIKEEADNPLGNFPPSYCPYFQEDEEEDGLASAEDFEEYQIQKLGLEKRAADAVRACNHCFMTYNDGECMMDKGAKRLSGCPELRFAMFPNLSSAAVEENAPEWVIENREELKIKISNFDFEEYERRAKNVSKTNR